MPKKKRQADPIPEETFNKWMDISEFFEDMTGQTVFESQEDFFKAVAEIESFEDIILCCGRGCGKTWSLAIIALWYAFVFSYHQKEPIDVAILAGSKDESKILFKYLRKILKGHDEINQYIAENQRGGMRFTRDYIEFKNGSSIEALPCSLTGVCGPRANLLIIDEAGLRDFKEDVKDEAFEIITGKPWARIIMASTPYDYSSPFVQIWTHAEDRGWRKFHWGQPDCPWINQKKIEKKMKDYSEIQFNIRVLGTPTELEGRMFDPKKLKKVLINPGDIHYADYAAVVAGLDWGQNISKTALVIVQINPVDNKVRIQFYKTWDNPRHDEVIPSILQICENYGVSKILVDSNPPNSCAMLEREAKHSIIAIDKIAFTHGQGDAMYHNLVRLIEKELMEIPHEYTGKMDTLTEQLREMQWIKDPKKRTDLVDALALACSEESRFLIFKKLLQSGRTSEEMKAWEEGLESSVNILPKLNEPENISYPKELEGNEEDRIWYLDPNLGFQRIMTKKEARGIYKNTGVGRKKPSLTKRGGY